MALLSSFYIPSLEVSILEILLKCGVNANELSMTLSILKSDSNSNVVVGTLRGNVIGDVVVALRRDGNVDLDVTRG